MLKTRLIVPVVLAVLGVLLVARGVWNGVYPVSVQSVAGVLLLVYVGLRWWTLR